MDAEAGDPRCLDFQVVLHADLDGFFVGAALKDDKFVILHSVVEDCRHAVQASEGGFGADLAAGEQFGQFVFLGESHESGMTIREHPPSRDSSVTGLPSSRGSQQLLNPFTILKSTLYIFLSFQDIGQSEP